MIAIIDYGAESQSVRNALDFIGCPGTVTSDPKEILSADGAILPGVGAFGSAMAEMERKRLTDTVKIAAKSGKPLLASAQECSCCSKRARRARASPVLVCLREKCFSFRQTKDSKFLTWDGILSIQKRKADCLGIFRFTHMYFVHSYYVRADNENIVTAKTDYGVTFDAAIEQGNLFGCQFHPEKSGAEGISILRRFAELAGGTENVRAEDNSMP